MAAGVRFLAVALLLALPAPATADWLQYGGDAARSGQADGPAPAWPDLAYLVEFAVWDGQFLSWPVIVDGAAYFLVNGTPWQAASPDGAVANPTTLVRLDLQMATATSWVIPGALYYLAYSDGALYASGHNRLVRLGLDGTISWERSVRVSRDTTTSDRPQTIAGVSCGAPAILADQVFVACSDSPAHHRLVVVEAFGLDGEPVWDEGPYIAALAPPPDCRVLDPQDPLTFEFSCPDRFVNQNPASLIGYHGPHISVNGGRLMMSLRAWGDTGGSPASSYGRYEVHAVDLATGEGTRLDGDYMMRNSGVSGVSEGPPPRMPPPPVANDRWTFITSASLRRFDAIEPTPYLPDRERSLPVAGIAWGAGAVLAGQQIWVASAASLHKVNLDLEDVPGFATFTLPPDEVWDQGPMTLAGDVVLARAHRTTSTAFGPATILYAIDASDGSLAWRLALADRATYAVADGLIVLLRESGKVEVLGTTQASLHPPRLDVTGYPAVGERVTVDLYSTQPGRFGPATRFRAEWGDGTASEWGPEPVLTHRFAAAIDTHARFFVTNDANQTASVPLTFHVGQKDPTIHLLNAPFSDHYQNTSFFILGLLGTGIAGLFGVYRTGRKRRRFERELRKLESDYKWLHPDPRACDAMLGETKSRARALFLQKRLDEAQSAFIERRVHELRQGLRLGTIEDKLKFLPYGMVAHLQRLLADARVDDWERVHFLEALERQTDLTSQQRQAARKVIDDWFTRDANMA